MSVSRRILAMYRRPRLVVADLLGDGTREDRVLAYLIAGCALMFLAQLPRLAREAHLTEGDLNMMMGGALLGWLMIAPLAFYLIAGISHVIALIFGGQGSFYTARLALFWALLAAAPIFLLLGLVLGFIGAGVQSTLVGSLWLLCFVAFWGTGLWVTERRVAA
ncbi:YIP1 family protein [Aliishimia ponticola]|uniref:YIP1 family protein n=1 Tax=Aliishimia ponticola TaxID=2499833 RepID=A0A4S4NIK3_9RHOB|nr:YIP1 family protein [Aliishimia ponticola]THH38557.1 YIP1 family protein [Aliishimia ponticola]